MTCERCMAFIYHGWDENLITDYGICALSCQETLGFFGCQIGENNVYIPRFYLLVGNPDFILLEELEKL